jgi:hypothetical protein
MCRNIKMLFNFEPPATESEIRLAAEQFVRKVTGFKKPSSANRKAFDKAVAEVTKSTANLLGSLETTASPRNREVVAAKAHDRAIKRFIATI